MEEDPLISRGNIQNADRQSETYGYTGQIGQGDNVKEDADKKKVNLTLLLLNTTCPDLTNNVDPDQLAFLKKPTDLDLHCLSLNM